MSHHTALAYEPCSVPLRTVHAFGVRLTVHEGIVGDVLEADRRWLRLGGPSFYTIEQHHTGAYVCRNSKGHSRGIAIDFNWQRQPMVSKRTPCPADPQMEEFYLRCWKPLGYGWGGYWRSKCDAMHVSKLVSEGGDGRLYVNWGTQPQPPKEWDEMASKEEIRALFREEVPEIVREVAQKGAQWVGGPEGVLIRPEDGTVAFRAFFGHYVWITAGQPTKTVTAWLHGDQQDPPEQVWDVGRAGLTAGVPQGVDGFTVKATDAPVLVQIWAKRYE